MTGTRPALDESPYLYTLTLSCPDEKWPTLGSLYKECQNSFRLLPPTKVRPTSIAGCGVEVVASFIMIRWVSMPPLIREEPLFAYEHLAADEHAYGNAPAQDSSSPCEEEL